MALSGHLITTTDTYNQYKRRAAFDWAAAWDYDVHDWTINWNYSVEILDSDVPTSSTYMSVGKWSVTVNGSTQSGNESGTKYFNGHQFATGNFHLPANSTFAISGYVYIGASSTLSGTRHNLVSSSTENINSLGPSLEDVPPGEINPDPVDPEPEYPTEIVNITYNANGGYFSDNSTTKVIHGYGSEAIQSPYSTLSNTTDRYLNLDGNSYTNHTLNEVLTWNTKSDGTGTTFIPEKDCWYSRNIIPTFDKISKDTIVQCSDGGNISRTFGDDTDGSSFKGYSGIVYNGNTSITKCYWFKGYEVSETVGNVYNTITYKTTIYCDVPKINTGTGACDWRYISDAIPTFTFNIVNENNGPIYNSKPSITLSEPVGNIVNEDGITGWVNVGGSLSDITSTNVWAGSSTTAQRCGVQIQLSVSFNVYPGMSYTITPEIVCKGGFPWFSGTLTMPKFTINCGSNNTYPESATELFAIWNTLKEPGMIDSIPVGDTKIYNGTNQQLLKSGGSGTSTMLYYVSTTPTEPSKSSPGWTETLPTRKDVGTYYIYYYCTENDDYLGTEIGGPVISTIVAINTKLIELPQINKSSELNSTPDINKYFPRDSSSTEAILIHGNSQRKHYIINNIDKKYGEYIANTIISETPAKHLYFIGKGGITPSLNNINFSIASLISSSASGSNSWLSNPEKVYVIDGTDSCVGKYNLYYACILNSPNFVQDPDSTYNFDQIYKIGTVYVMDFEISYDLNGGSWWRSYGQNCDTYSRNHTSSTDTMNISTNKVILPDSLDVVNLNNKYQGNYYLPEKPNNVFKGYSDTTQTLPYSIKENGQRGVFGDLHSIRWSIDIDSLKLKTTLQSLWGPGIFIYSEDNKWLPVSTKMFL